MLKQIYRISKRVSSNCTFMELKLNKSMSIILIQNVLIVPLWN